MLLLIYTYLDCGVRNEIGAHSAILPDTSDQREATFEELIKSRKLAPCVTKLEETC